MLAIVSLAIGRKIGREDENEGEELTQAPILFCLQLRHSDYLNGAFNVGAKHTPPVSSSSIYPYAYSKDTSHAFSL